MFDNGQLVVCRRMGVGAGGGCQQRQHSCHEHSVFHFAVTQAQLRIDDLEWSDKFSLDTVGSSGTVQCKSKAKDTQNAEVRAVVLLLLSFLLVAGGVLFFVCFSSVLSSVSPRPSPPIPPNTHSAVPPFPPVLLPPPPTSYHFAPLPLASCPLTP